MRPVIDKLILAGLLQGGISGSAIFNILPAVSTISRNIDIELRKSAIQRQIADVGVRNSKFVTQRLITVWTNGVVVDSVVAEPEVGQPLRGQHIVPA